MPPTRPHWAHLRREGDGRWRVTGTVLAVLATVVGLVSVLVHGISSSSQLLIVLAAGAHYPMWAAPVALVLAVLVRRWATAGVAAALTALVLIVQVPPTIATDPPAHGTPIIVLQANLKLGTADPAAVVRLVEDHGVDLLATEELTLVEQNRLVAAGLKRLLPYSFTEPSTPGTGNGIGMWSRYPLSQQVFDPRFALKVIRAHVALPGGKGLTLFAVHLLPPWPYDPTEWTKEVPMLGALLRAQPTTEPVLAPGDYNSTTDHAQFRGLLHDGYADAADQAGAGYLPSYPADRWLPPLIGIDHVLARGAVATSAETVDMPGSDHRGLLTRIVLDTG